MNDLLLALKQRLPHPGAHERDFRVWLDREKGNKVVTRIVEVGASSRSWKTIHGPTVFRKEHEHSK